MKFIIENNSVRLIYTSMENLSEQDAKIFRYLLYFRASEFTINSTIYRLDFNKHTVFA